MAIKSAKRKFLLKNLLKGLAWLALFVIAFVLIKDQFDFSAIDWLAHIYEDVTLVYLVFLLSELVFGIIPPEVFMVWSIHHGAFGAYYSDVALLSVISYTAGVLGYLFGRYFSSTRLFLKLEDTILFRYRALVRKFGGYLVLVAAVTPLPFSGICMLVGAVRFSPRNFLIIAAIRFVRFIVYGYIIWQADRL